MQSALHPQCPVAFSVQAYAECWSQIGQHYPPPRFSGGARDGPPPRVRSSDPTHPQLRGSLQARSKIREAVAEIERRSSPTRASSTRSEHIGRNRNPVLYRPNSLQPPFAAPRSSGMFSSTQMRYNTPSPAWQRPSRPSSEAPSLSNSWAMIPAGAASPLLTPTPATASSSTAPAPTASIDIENLVKSDPLLSKEMVKRRKAAYGMEEPRTETFLNKCEFISLGCFCGVAFALQAVGIRGAAYPFDWVRIPVDGLIWLLENKCEDYMTFSNTKLESQHTVYCNTRWGGSFWHHNPGAADVQEQFSRRVQRLMNSMTTSTSSEASDRPCRLFIRAVNSSFELDQTARLYDALQRMLPQHSIYLLVLVDLQKEEGFLSVRSLPPNVLFYRLHEEAWTDYLSGKCELRDHLMKIGESYGKALGIAAGLWSGARPANGLVGRLPDLPALLATVDPFHGGDPGGESFMPKPVGGASVSWFGSARAFLSPTVPEPAQSAPLEPRTAVAGGSRSGSVQLLTRPSPSLTTPVNLPADSLLLSRSLSRSRQTIGALVERQWSRPPHRPTPMLAAAAQSAAQSAASSRVPSPMQSWVPSPHVAASVAEQLQQQQQQQKPMPRSRSLEPPAEDDRRAHVELPNGIRPGDFLTTQAFGRKVKLTVPDDASPGQKLWLRYHKGRVTFALDVRERMLSKSRLSLPQGQAERQSLLSPSAPPPLTIFSSPLLSPAVPRPGAQVQAMHPLVSTYAKPRELTSTYARPRDNAVLRMSSGPASPRSTDARPRDRAVLRMSSGPASPRGPRDRGLSSPQMKGRSLPKYMEAEIAMSRNERRSLPKYMEADLAERRNEVLFDSHQNLPLASSESLKSFHGANTSYQTQPSLPVAVPAINCRDEAISAFFQPLRREEMGRTL